MLSCETFVIYYTCLKYHTKIVHIFVFLLQEEEINEIKKQEVGVDISVDTKHQTMAGITFPMVPDALEAVKNFTTGKLQYVQLKIGELFLW